MVGIEYCMAFAQGLDVEEGEDLFGFEELEGGDVACGEGGGQPFTGRA